jgi:hypothetical protein
MESSCLSLAALTNRQQGRGHKSVTRQTMTYDHALGDILSQRPYRQFLHALIDIRFTSWIAIPQMLRLMTK